jgi:hypothetical protein
VAADLERLQAVVSRLTPLSTAVNGDLIKAQDWNALVAAVMDIARAVLAEGPVTVPPHDHVGQVKSTWLDPRLASTLKGGVLADPEAATRLTGAEHAVTTVDGRVTGLATELAQLRLRLTEATARDLERESQVSSLGLRVSGINDAGADVQAMRTTLASVQDALGRALTVAQQLTVNGVPVDLPALGQKVTALETFRDGLRAPDGSPLDAARLRADLQAATATLVSKEQMAAAIAAKPTALTAQQLAKITDSVTASLRNDLNTQFTQLGDAVRADVTQRLNGVRDVVASAVADAVPSMRDAVLVKLRPEMTSAVATAATDQQARTDQRLADAGASLRQEFDGKLATSRTEQAALLTADIARQLDTGLQPVQASLADLSAKSAATSATLVELNTRSVATTTALTKLTTSVTAVGQRVDAVAASESSARAALETSLRNDIATRDVQLNARIDSRVSALDASVNQRLNDTTSTLRLEMVRPSTSTTTPTATSPIFTTPIRIDR